VDIDDLRKLIFDRLTDPIACLGCAGPPECEHECEPGEKHDTFLAMCQGVIEVTIDDQEFEIRVIKAPATRGWSRKDLNLDA